MRKLLVAVGLLGILGAIAVLTLSGGGDPGRGSLLEQDSAAQAHARQLASQAEAQGRDFYRVTARSKSGNVFTITKTTSGTTRTCSWAEGTRGGGCTGPAW